VARVLTVDHWCSSLISWELFVNIDLLIDRINQQHFDAQPLNSRATAPTRIGFLPGKDPGRGRGMGGSYVSPAVVPIFVPRAYMRRMAALATFVALYLLLRAMPGWVWLVAIVYAVAKIA